MIQNFFSPGCLMYFIIKEIQISSELRKMEKEGLLSQSTVEDIIKTKFEYPLPSSQNDDDVFVSDGIKNVQ